MPQPATTTPSPSFAGMLAALAAPGQKRPPVRDLDGLEEDVATLSYERALRTHARYRSPQADQPAMAPIPSGEDIRIFEALPAAELAATAMGAVMDAAPAPFEPESHVAKDGEFIAQRWVEPASAEPETAQQFTAEQKMAGENALTPLQRNLKCASITIRMSKTECAQLRSRAAESGMTVSSYLRSCSLEAESLRAMVKDTMLQLRTEAEKVQQNRELDQNQKARTAPVWLVWMRHLWLRVAGPRTQVARA